MAAPGKEKARKPKDFAKKHDKPSFKKKPPPKKELHGGRAPPPEAFSSFLSQDDDPDFPRGGARVLSREEVEEARAEAEVEFEREARDSKKGKGDRKKKGLSKRSSSYGGDDDLGSLFGEGVTGKLPRFANRITLKNISPGMKLWGVIAEVNSKDLVISLPGGLRGLARSEEVSDIVFDDRNKDSESIWPQNNLRVGQLVSGVVTQVDDDRRVGNGTKRIWLSLRLSVLYKGLTLDAVQDGMVLTAQVKSVEDHGYIMHFGVSSFTGFLATRDAGGRELNNGQLLQGVAKSIDKVRAVVHLNSDPDLVTKCITRDLKGLSIDLLVPGMMVNARVHCTLENGIMLSFLTYFTGTVDIFHLQNSFPRETWKHDYARNKKVNARILFIDPSTRAVGLTLNSHLVSNKAPPSFVKTGDIFDHARVVRVDKGSGLLLEIPSSPVPSPAYVNITDVANEVPKLEKKFKEGDMYRIRVLGRRHLEGLAIGTLKASAFEGAVFTHADVKPGMLVKAKVISVEEHGAIVQFSSGVKALCPLPHMSEFEIAKPAKKFKVGAELIFRVLGCKSKRITVTHKKTLVKSKLNVLASYADATEGVLAHGWITKLEKHGCFVSFYNGVRGFAHRSELGLDPGSGPHAAYHVGQVVKCRVISSVPAARKINLSFTISPKRVSHDNFAKVGGIVSAVVERLTPSAVIVHCNKHGYMKGTIPNEHLADHQGQATLLRSLLIPGYEFDQLLVLDVDGNNLTLSAKHSLISSAKDIPVEISQIHPSLVVHGYVCNIIETGCFVRFLGRLTGFSPKNKTTDDQIGDLLGAFYLGQSIRCYVLDVNSETGRIKLSLKQSCCFSTNISFIEGYFLLEKKIADLQVSEGYSGNWLKDFSLGSVVEGEIQERNEFGVVLHFKSHADVVGFVADHQLGGIRVEKGSLVRALVLDISGSDNLVDLSLKTELVSRADKTVLNAVSSKKKRKREETKDLELHQTVNAVVEIVKENYLVLSIPEYDYAIGYAFITDYNTQKFPQKHFVNRQSVVVTVGALASPASSGRLLLLLNSLTEVSETSSSKRAKKRSSYDVGSVVEGEIIDIKPLELILKFGTGFIGRVHITEVVDSNEYVGSPFADFKVGQVVNARIVARAQQSGKFGKGSRWELSLRPSLLAGSIVPIGTSMAEDFNFSVGEVVRGYVVKVDSDWVWLTVSRYVMAHLFILDSASEPSELEQFEKRYSLGQFVNGRIIGVNKEKKLLRLTSLESSFSYSSLFDHESAKDGKENSLLSVNSAENISKGDLVSGRIRKVLPGVGGLLVQIGPHLHGRVHYTELTDMWVSDPLSLYHERQFVKCKVLEVNRSPEGFVHVDLSLRASLQGIKSVIPTTPNIEIDSFQRLEKVDDLQLNMPIQGYVKNVTSKGCFVMLSRSLDARILLSNLSDGYIESPEKEFPVGKLVHGKVFSVEISSRKVDLTLKTDVEKQSSKLEAGAFRNLHVGDVISGRIRRVESYGLFITIDNTSVVGLCHISEISIDHIHDIETTYKAGEKVVAKILKIDEEKQRISLGMKKAYFVDANHLDSITHGDNASSAEATFLSNGQEQEGLCEILARVQSRASVPLFHFPVDNSEDSVLDEGVREEKVDIVVSKENERKLKKKAKEKRELEIRASEERILQGDVPRTADEFEKLVRSSPNSSFLWIKYMAFMLSLADVEKARGIAERALKTINIREEGEKFNIWVAYFNLENEYGSPPEDAVKQTFQRALQYCDPKKLHLALLGMYERTEQYRLADELIEKMKKKFRNSCKIWLRSVQCLLKQGKDGIQSLVNRALLSLPRNKHIKFISQAAILEFKSGVPDRGRSMLEGVLLEYPKRTDIWSIYLDQEIRLGDKEVIRALFERATCLSLPPKKMKFLFNKYLEYESSHGDEDKIEHVKRKALEYL